MRFSALSLMYKHFASLNVIGLCDRTDGYDSNYDGESEIPMVDAIAAQDCIPMVSCHVEEGDEIDRDGEITVTTTATAASLPMSSARVTDNRSAVSTLEMGESIAVVLQSSLEDREALELSSPSFAEDDHEEQPQQSPMTMSATVPTTPELRVVHRHQITMTPLEMASPAPSLVVTDERHHKKPTNTVGPVGKWRTTLCSCWCDNEVICTSIPWMACCCNAILLGQLMTRLRLNWCGREDDEAAVRTFGIIVSISFVCLLLCALGVGFFVAPFFLIWLVVLATRIRNHLRHHYHIPPHRHFACGGGSDKDDGSDSWGGVMEDLCCSLWCSCCSSIQMIQQTHDTINYPYECFSPTGLPTFAPVVPRACSMIERQ